MNIFGLNAIPIQVIARVFGSVSFVSLEAVDGLRFTQ